MATQDWTIAGRPHRLALIAAVSDNAVIGYRGRLPWHLPADLRRFKALTMGHHLIMGRKTYESIGRPLPGRTTIVVTHQQDYQAVGAIVCHDLETAMAYAAGDDLAFVVGGATLYRQAIRYAQLLHLTRVHAELQGDTYFPNIDWTDWLLMDRHRVAADARNPYDLTFETYERVSTRHPDASYPAKSSLAKAPARSTTNLGTP